MNKLFKKIAGSIIGMAMAIGVGVAAGKSAVHMARAADETVTFSEQGYSNQQAIASYQGTDFSITFDKGTNSNAPKYYTSGTAIRAYGGNYFTVSSSKAMTTIAIGFGSSDSENEITTDKPTYASGTWTGEATSVTFTIGGTTGNRRLSSIGVTFKAAADVKVQSVAVTGAPSESVSEAKVGDKVTLTASATLAEGTGTPSFNWLSDNTSVATVSANANSSTAVVTYVGEGTAHISATTNFAAAEGGSNVGSATITIAENGLKGCKKENPLTVSEARELIEDYTTDSSFFAFVKGKINGFYNHNDEPSQYNNNGMCTTHISDDGTTSNEIQAYNLKDENNALFTSETMSKLVKGNEIIVKGNFLLFEKNNAYTYELTNGCVAEYVQKQQETKTLDSIVVGGTYATEFEYGAAFTFGGTVTAKYVEDGAQDKVLEASEYTITPAVGTQLTESGKVTISYTEGNETKTAEYNITVGAAPAVITGIEATYGEEIVVGHKIDGDQLTIRYVYEGGSKVEISASDYASVEYYDGPVATGTKITDPENYVFDTVGEVTIGVKLGEHTATFVVTVVEDSPVTPTDETLLITGDSFSLTSTALTEDTDLDYEGVTYVLSSGAKVQSKQYITGTPIDADKDAIYIKEGGYLYNKTALSNTIAKFEMFMNGSVSDETKIRIGFGSSALTTALTSQEITVGGTDYKGKVYSYTVPAGSTFFRIDATNKNPQVQIKITFGTPSGGGEGGEGGGEGTGEKGTLDNPYTVAEALAVAKALPDKGEVEGIYTKGIIVTDVEASTSNAGTYRFSIADTTDGEQLLIYWGSSQTAPKQTDEVLVHGTLKNFVQGTNHIYEYSQSAFTITKEGEGGQGGGEGTGEKGSQNNPYTVDEALAVAKALPDAGSTSKKVYTKGVITSSVEESSQTAGTYRFDLGGTTDTDHLVVWWGACDTAPKQGDEILVYGTLKNFVQGETHKYEVINATFTITKAGEGGEGGGEGSNEKGSQNNPYTVAEALEVAKALNPAGATPSKVYTKGIITSTVKKSDQDGSYLFDIADEKGGEELLVYWATCDTQPEEGDEVLVNGKLKNFVKNDESTYEIIDGSFTITKSGGEGGSGEGGEGGEGGGEEVTKATITFMANGGTGSMAAVQVDKGSQYTLPECKFTAPANKVFKGWKVNNSGSVKQPGEKITVSADIKLYAQWETRTLVNLTVTAPTKTDYFVGDKIDITGFKVVATYSNGDTEDVTNKIGSITIDTSKPGQKVITVTYDGMTQTFTINVTRNPDVHDGCHCSILAGSALISITTLMGAGLLMLRKRKEK